MRAGAKTEYQPNQRKNEKEAEMGRIQKKKESSAEKTGRSVHKNERASEEEQTGISCEWIQNHDQTGTIDRGWIGREKGKEIQMTASSSEECRGWTSPPRHVITIV